MPPKKKRLPKKEDIVRSLKGFVKDEDGFVSKETILKVGLSTIAGLAAFGAASDAGARQPDHANHSNNLNNGNTTGCFAHTNTVSHTSY